MQIPGSNNHREPNMHEALQRDAERARELPPFDPALHATVMRRIHATSRERNARSAGSFLSLAEGWSRLFNAGLPGTNRHGWLLPSAAAILVVIISFGISLRPSSEEPTTTQASPSRNVDVQPFPSSGDHSLRHLSLVLLDLPGKNPNPDFLVASLDGAINGKLNPEISEVPVRLDCGYNAIDTDRFGILLGKPAIGTIRPF